MANSQPEKIVEFDMAAHVLEIESRLKIERDTNPMVHGAYCGFPDDEMLALKQAGADLVDSV